ncbi:MAG: GNAT family N-acetyltransferase [Pseudomonadota bacterium]
MDKEVETSRLKLRILRPSDAGALELYASDPRVARMTTAIPHPYPPGQAVSFIARMLSGQTNEYVRAIAMGAEGEDGLMGLVRLRPTDQAQRAELTFWVAPAFWGTGYARESVAAICVSAAEWGIHSLIAKVFQDNEAAKKVLLHNGFSFTGPGEVFSVSRAAMVPTFNYSKALRGA